MAELRSRAVPGVPGPLAFGQEQLWLVDAIIDVPGVLNDGTCVRLRGALNADLLRAAFADTVSRHAVLRTTFVSVDGAPRQRIAERADIDFTVVEVAGEAACTAAAVAVADSPFDLGSGPLLRVRLFRLGPADHVLLVVVHHIVCDARSHALLLAEVADAYGVRVRGEHARRPPPPIQYADVAYWQRERLTGQRLTKLLTYWRKRLEDADPVLRLPTDRPRPQRRRTPGRIVRSTLSGPAAESLDTVARGLSTTPAMVLLALFRVLLARLSGQADTLIGVPVSTRNRVELESMIGFLVNLVAVRGDVSDDPEFAVLVRREQASTMAAFAYAELPFEVLVRELAPVREPGSTALVQATFSYDAESGDLPPWPGGLAVSRFALPVAATQYDLTLAVVRIPDGLELNWAHNDEIFTAETARGFADGFDALLLAAVADPHRPVSQLAGPAASPADGFAPHDDIGLYLEESEPAATGRPPAGPVEQAVADIWTDVLGVPAPGADVDFFAAGGHSLGAAKLALRLQEDFGLDVSIAHLFSVRTVEGQALMLAELFEAEVAGRDSADVNAAFTTVNG